jgi:predicted ATPase
MGISVEFGAVEYALECGLPQMVSGPFGLDPQIKEEKILGGEAGRRALLLERKNGTAWARDADGRRVPFVMEIPEAESALSCIRDPHRFPQISAARGEFLRWRFYHGFRTDADSPLRQAQVGTRTYVLDDEGRHLAAALQTIRENGDDHALERAVDRAFPGARLHIHHSDGRLQVAMRMPGFGRPFMAQELSDGTLRYLCLVAALLSPLPPPLLALNEPETSIHADLLPPLAELIAEAASRSQLWVTTHSETLARGIEEHTGARPIRLEKVGGATRIAGQGALDGWLDEDD